MKNDSNKTDHKHLSSSHNYFVWCNEISLTHKYITVNEARGDRRWRDIFHKTRITQIKLRNPHKAVIESIYIIVEWKGTRSKVTHYRDIYFIQPHLYTLCRDSFQYEGKCNAKSRYISVRFRLLSIIIILLQSSSFIKVFHERTWKSFIIFHIYRTIRFALFSILRSLQV